MKRYIIGLLALASAACNDYLDVQPSKTTSLVPATTDHLEYLLNDYSTFYTEDNSTAIFSSDDYGLYMDIYNVQPTIYRLENLQFALWDTEYLPAASSDNFWTNEYEKIFIANMVLEYIPQVSGDEATKARLKAEAHLVRAYSLWELANTYCLPYTEANKGELGLVLKQSTSFDESEERATLEATYQLIEQDIPYKVERRLTQNDPSRIIARVPAELAPGAYTLRIITQYSNSAVLLKEPRTLEYDQPLGVS